MIAKLLVLLIIFGSIPVYAEDTLETDTVITVAIEKNEGVITNVLTSFVFYKNYFELWEAFPEYAGQIEGVSYCIREVENNMAWCTVHVIEPSVLDGEHTLTLGHEVEHGIWGVEYHVWSLD